jgi:hypothetical protein
VLRAVTRGNAARFHLLMIIVGLALAIGMVPVAARALAAVIAVLGAVLFARGTRTAIWASDLGVTAAVSGRVTTHLAWAEVQRFELDPEDRAGPGPGLALGAWRRNGQWVPLADHGRDSRGRYQGALQDLQAELARRQP